ncbi:MAG: PLxRFG domain-containing protein, partial [Desulfobacteraceae bacterium]
PTTIDEYRRQMGSIRNYFPHLRYGSHYIQAIEETEIEDPDTGGTIKERRVVYREHFNAPLGVNLKKWSKFKQIEAKYPGAELTIGKVEKIPEDVFTIPIPTEAIEAVMIAAVKRVPDPKMQQAFKEILPQATADALRSRGWGSHMINRKGILGHETDDIKRVLFDYKAGLYGWLTKVEASRDMSVTIGKVDATGKPRLWAAMRKYIHDMMANADWADQVINSMRAVFFAKYLGGNIKTAALNLTQNFIAGWPRLGMEVGKSAGMVMKASGNAIVASVTKNKRLPEDEQRLLHELLEEGVTDSNFLTEVRGQIGSNVFSASNKVMRVLGWPMGFAEGLNRSTLALAAYRAAVSGKIQRPETLTELGLDKGDKAPYEIAKRFAETVVNDAHFVYGKSNRPEALRGDVGKWGSLAYTFRTFSHNLINLWSWMYKQGGPGRKALLKSIGAMAVIGGLSSIPLYKTFMHIIREATGDDWEEKLIDSWLPDQAHLMRDMIVYGVPAGMGFTLGGSIGMELPVFDKMKLNQSLTGQLGSNIGEIIGVPWAVIEDLEAAANSYRSGQKLRAMEYLLPTAASNPLKAIRMHTTGQTSISGRPISDPGSNAPRKITVKEAIGKAMGLQPVSSTKSWDLYKTIQAYAEFKQAKQRSFANRIANAWRAGDMKKVREVASEIEAWNKEQLCKGRYRYLMTNEDIIRALQARSRSGQPPKYLWQDTGQMMRMRGVGLQ